MEVQAPQKEIHLVTRTLENDHYKSNEDWRKIIWSTGKRNFDKSLSDASASVSIVIWHLHSGRGAEPTACELIMEHCIQQRHRNEIESNCKNANNVHSL